MQGQFNYGVPGMCRDTKIRGISKGYFKYGDTKMIGAQFRSGSFSVQVSPSLLAGNFHSLSNVTPALRNSAHSSTRYGRKKC